MTWVKKILEKRLERLEISKSKFSILQNMLDNTKSKVDQNQVKKLREWGST